MELKYIDMVEDMYIASFYRVIMSVYRAVVQLEPKSTLHFLSLKFKVYTCSLSVWLKL